MTRRTGRADLPLHGGHVPVLLSTAAARGPSDFADLLLIPGVGARTVEPLAMGAPYRFRIRPASHWLMEERIDSRFPCRFGFTMKPSAS